MSRRPRPPAAPLALVALVASLAPGCGDDPDPAGRLRFLHFATEAGPAEVVLADPGTGEVVARSGTLGFGDASARVRVPVGAWDVLAEPREAAPTPLLNGLPVEDGDDRTLVLGEVGLDGGGDDLLALLVGGAPPAPPAGRAAVRLVHAAPGLPDVRLYVDGALLEAGVPYGADVVADDLSPTAFTLGIDYRDEPDPDAVGDVLALGEGARATLYLVRRALAGRFLVEVRIFEGGQDLGTVSFQ